MRPVRRNHAQTREAKAEPVDNYDGRLDRFETASLQSESEQTEETDQPLEQEPTPPPRRSRENVYFPQYSMTFLWNELNDFLWNEHLSEILSKFRHCLRDLKTLLPKNSSEKWCLSFQYDGHPIINFIFQKGKGVTLCDNHLHIHLHLGMY